MSVTVSTCFQICNSPLNLSKSKHLYSFPKSTRFKDFPPKYNCEQSCYDLPSSKMKRSAAFGYGNKYDFTKSASKNPGPDTYQITSVFSPNKTRGPSIGLGREVKRNII